MEEVNEASGREENSGEAALKQKAVVYFKKRLAKTLGLPSQKIQTDEPFEKYGIDSVMVMQLTNELEIVFGFIVQKRYFFEYQTIEEISQYFLTSYRPKLIKLLNVESSRSEASKSHRPAEKVLHPKRGRSSRSRFESGVATPLQSLEEVPLDIAIIGPFLVDIRRRENLAEYWHNLYDGKDLHHRSAERSLGLAGLLCRRSWVKPDIITANGADS